MLVLFLYTIELHKIYFERILRAYSNKLPVITQPAFI